MKAKKPTFRTKNPKQNTLKGIKLLKKICACFAHG
jgi:hypothetical protein